MVTALGYQALIAESGADALRIFNAREKGIDLVILDMVMPYMDGGETFDKLKAMDPNVKVLLSSGYSLEGQAAEIMNRGCNGFLQKPFNLKVLSNKIVEIINGRK